jgi:holo-ACP synthase CitX
MPLERLKREILQSRDKRQQEIDRLTQMGKTLVSLSSNIPGADKKPEGFNRIFAHVCGLIKESAEPAYTCDDALGSFALFLSDMPKTELKLAMVGIENMYEWGRLMDIDVYDDAGLPVSRVSLGFEERGCLICSDTAKSCIKAGRHSMKDLMRAANDIIDSYNLRH